jgi:solute carrier family 25 phosphate transporter 3
MSPETKENLSGTSKVGITLGSGVIAGFAAAILSHVSNDIPDIVCLSPSISSPVFNEMLRHFPQPADTLLSQINKGHGPKGSMIYRLGVLGKEAGFKGLFAGLGPRMSKLSLTSTADEAERGYEQS